MRQLRLLLFILLATTMGMAYGFKKGDLNEDGAVDGGDVSILSEIVLVGDEGSVKSVTYTVKGVKFTMIELPGGSFVMGGTPEQNEAESIEIPIHNVTIYSFQMGQTEVTQELWEAVMDYNNSNFYGASNPVENVSWDDCQEFITKLNALTGVKFRLPTEAEWEYAARGGQSCGSKYAGSNDIERVGWCRSNSSNRTHPVATKQPNDFGLYDMSGNVYEWCQDYYAKYNADTQTDPQGADYGTQRVCRGGSYDLREKFCRVSARNCKTPSARSDNLGLRLAR